MLAAFTQCIALAAASSLYSRSRSRSSFSYAQYPSCTTDNGGNCSPWGRQTYWASLSSLDAALGLLRRGLRRIGVAENTLILFHSDNGPDRHMLGSVKAFGQQLSGIKFETRDGGIRVPAVLEWPRVTASLLPSDRTVVTPVSTMDIFPTLLAITSTPPLAGLQRLDGEDVSPLILGRLHPSNSDGRARPFARKAGIPIRFRNMYGWIDATGQFKWGQHYAKGSGTEQLIDMWRDPGELDNIAGSMGATVADMRKAYNQWFANIQEEQNAM